MKKKKLYGVFVDFERAFPSVRHWKLFNKLTTTGISSKLVRIIEALYAIASMRIKTALGFTDPILVTEGLLQGEQLSPLLFCIFISDMEEYFLEQGCTGVEINEKLRVLVLLYADDLILLGDTPEDLQRKLDTLHQYCMGKGLKVNIKKTKVVVFRKGGRLPESLKFNYNNEPLEIVNSYVYLGVCMSSSGLFHKAADQMCGKARQKSGIIRTMLSKGRPNSWDTVTKLFDSCVMPTLLYASPVWSLRYLDRLERVHMKFFKDTLYLPRNTPGHLLRYELGRTSIIVETFRRLMQFWGKILRTDESRILKLCYMELLHERNTGLALHKYNWASQLQSILGSIGYSQVWRSQSYETLVENFGGMVERLREKTLAEDWTKVQDSQFNNWYSSVKDYNEPAFYLQLRTSISKMRMVARFRLYSTKYSKFSVYTAQGTHVFQSEPDSVCTLCNLGEPETPAHFLWHCPIYNKHREKYLRSSLLPLPDPRDLPEINSFYFYVMSCLKIRAFILNE
jgi:hypothetical protein